MSTKWRNTSVKIVLILFVVCIMLFAFSFVNHTSFTGKSFAEAYGLPIGQSMFDGDSILDDKTPIEVPLLGNPLFIVHEITTLDLKGLLLTLTTGYVPFDYSTISSEGIDSYGNARGFEGPGYLTLDGDKLAVKAPDNYIWGYSSPYKVLTKTNSGVDVVLLTGDKEHNTQKLCNELGIKKYYSSLLPDQKIECLEKELSNKYATGFIGDGINDAASIKKIGRNRRSYN